VLGILIANEELVLTYELSSKNVEGLEELTLKN
jgi:hypothetical protein